MPKVTLPSASSWPAGPPVRETAARLLMAKGLRLAQHDESIRRAHKHLSHVRQPALAVNDVIEAQFHILDITKIPLYYLSNFLRRCCGGRLRCNQHRGFAKTDSAAYTVPTRSVRAFLSGSDCPLLWFFRQPHGKVRCQADIRRYAVILFDMGSAAFTRKNQPRTRTDGMAVIARGPPAYSPSASAPAFRSG